MGQVTSIALAQQYPESKYNLLGNVSVATQIPDIQSPVIQVIKISPDPNKGEVYLQEKGGWIDRNGNEHLDKYAITKNGLKKLADGAGIKMVSSEHVLPTKCQKCAAANRAIGKPVPCGTCTNKDIAFKVTISVPQLTGDTLLVSDTNEIIYDNLTFASDKAREQFLKFMPQICEAKALNGAIRTALHLKGTYTLQELQKPFVLAYLVPNLNNKEVKEAAIQSMFASSANLYGTSAPTVEHIEAKAPEVPQIEASEADQETIDAYIDQPDEVQSLPDNTLNPKPVQPPTPQQEQSQGPRTQQTVDLHCVNCGRDISQKVYNYSVKRFGRPLCYGCQDDERWKKS